eukprot:gene14324-17410_t
MKRAKLVYAVLYTNELKAYKRLNNSGIYTCLFSVGIRFQGGKLNWNFGGGPLWGVNTVEVAYSDNGETYTLQIYPDIVNDDLRNSGKPMHFYIMPNSVRMAKNDQGKYQFHFTKFAGVRTEDANIATQGQEEVAGGVVSFTSTLELPPGVIDSLKDQIAAEIKKNAKLN